MYYWMIAILSLVMTNAVWADEIVALRTDAPATFFTRPDPLATEWKGMKEAKVTLLPQNITTPSLAKTSVSGVQVKALHNGKWLALRIEWADSSMSDIVETDQASDACAIQFPLQAAAKTSPFMGAKGFPVHILQWKALWQHDLDQGYRKTKDLYPNTWVDTYRFGTEIARNAGNPMSSEMRPAPIEELNAAGFGTLVTQAHQNALANGIWKDGEWEVVIVRPLVSGDDHDAALKIDVPSSLAFAVWDGGDGNIGARKNYSTWVPLVLK